ncbi:hypothetical protein [Desulfosporosinus sp. OT]|uniref:hypothetical protein n=1 Tax=Desulfosporosinus sp. OT TaxID=913865 RepID=UPI00058BE98C|nr:hypothetical protein [Desulfosporosinus sp. OT]
MKTKKKILDTGFSLLLHAVFAVRRITEGLQHRRKYGCSNPTSQTLGTLSETAGNNIFWGLIIMGGEKL